MKPHSLRLRLLTLAALWVSLALVIAGTAIFFLFTANVERGMRDDLEAGLIRLVALINPEAEEPTLREGLPDPRYSVPYSGLYWQIQDTETGAVTRSRSLWDVRLDMPAVDPLAGEVFVTIPGPQGQVLAALARSVRFEVGAGQKTYTLIVAENRQALDESIKQFSGDMALALLVLGIAIFAAAWLQVYLGLKPLDALRHGLEAIRRDAKAQLGDAFPSELMPLVGEVNELIAVREKSVEFARARASDLAHGLKTPLSVLSATADRLRAKGDAESAETLETVLTEMEDRVDYQLRLARLRLRSASHVLSASLDEALSRTIAVLQKTLQGEVLDWQVDVGGEVMVNMDRHDLIELVGVLLENAAQWARTRVRVGVRRVDGRAELNIEDDGPGLNPQQATEVGIRGRRLDETRKGSGFGLAIALEIVALNNGTVELDRSDLGGLAVRVRIPVVGG